jgi:PA14 domain-containing protein
MLAIALLFALAQEPPVPTFGTTVYSNSGFTGQVYHVPRGTLHLPKFSKLQSKGAIYTTSLNVPARNFREGFPGVTMRWEWFAIDYEGKVWIDSTAIYRFSLTADDAGKLYIDGHEVVNNDGIHPPRTRTGRRELKLGVHTMRVEYMQGPADQVALVLEIAGPGEDFHVFNTNDFKPSPSGQ